MLELLRTENLTKEYRKRKVVDGVSIQVEKGKIIGLLGPNGAGKSTTFRMVAGLVRPDNGEIFVKKCEDGIVSEDKITHLPMYKRALMGIGYLPQEPSVFTKLTVYENIMLILEQLKIPRQRRRKRVDELLEEMDLKRLQKSLAGSLSGGERRRLEVTRALSTSPSFMMWDEPFAAVDPKVVKYLQDIIVKLKERGIGILITDHKPRETLSITDYAYVISQGKILQEGDSKKLAADEQVQNIYLGDDVELYNTIESTILAIKELDSIKNILNIESIPESTKNKIEMITANAPIKARAQRILLKRGEELLNHGQVQDAIVPLSIAIMYDEKKELYQAYFNRGLCFMKIRNFRLALEDFQTAAKLAPVALKDHRGRDVRSLIGDMRNRAEDNTVSEDDIKIIEQHKKSLKELIGCLDILSGNEDEFVEETMKSSMKVVDAKDKRG